MFSFGYLFAIALHSRINQIYIPASGSCPAEPDLHPPHSPCSARQSTLETNTYGKCARTSERRLRLWKNENDIVALAGPGLDGQKNRRPTVAGILHGEVFRAQMTKGVRAREGERERKREL